MATPDKLFKQTHDWFRDSVDQALAAVPAAQRDAVEALLWRMLGLDAAAADPDLTDFETTAAVIESLAGAAQIAAESLTTLEYVRQAREAAGGPAAALALIVPLLQQIERLRSVPNERYPSAYSLGKILLTLSGDARASSSPANRKAEKLAMLAGAASAADIETTQTALGILTLVTGCMIDRSFTRPTNDAAGGWAPAPLPELAAPVTITLPLAGAGLPAGTGLDLRFKQDAPTGVEAKLNLAVHKSQPLDGATARIDLHATPGATLFVPIAPIGAVAADAAGFAITIGASRAGTLAIGRPSDEASLTIGELGASVTLQNGAPRVSVFARRARAAIRPPALLKLLLGGDVAIDFDLEAQADEAGHLRLRNGTGLKATLPAPTLPTGPFKVLLINLAVTPAVNRAVGFRNLQFELSASFGVDLGPFQASVDRFGLLVGLDVTGAPALEFGLKMPNGIGLRLDAGIVRGGGYLDVDPSGREYGGVLELQMLAVDVKAIALLSGSPDVGFSLLLLVYGQFPPIQLSFGFTLTGVGGLIAVQHTTDRAALSRGLGNGSLDAILFPDNPVGDAPKIISSLRTLFPVKGGGFIIGPMLELGWGTPSLVTVRIGLLIEAGQFAILGQAIVQLPPLVSADFALLRLQVDIAGSVVFDPLRIAFDAKLRDSRVAFLTLTGQFAFRASFGANPTFLISAGGFHPGFREIPSDIPAPFDRVGTSLDIGIVGMSFKGYFAITSATVQTGSDLRIWADLGVASIEGGWGFDAICYLAPRFYFAVDLRAYVSVHLFGEDFAAIRIEGLLAGPGRWRIAGRGTVELPLLPDFDISIDEAWGTDRDTPEMAVSLPTLVGGEIGKMANWSAQLPRDGEALITLADLQGVTDLLAHPLGTLVFQQKLIPFELRLAKVSGSRIDGANEYFGPSLVLTQGAAPAQPPVPTATKRDFFAAAQFLEMSPDDKLAKPSFESFAAGYALRDDDYAVGTIVPQDLGYEEVDLGAERVPRRQRFSSRAMFTENVHQALIPFGAAGRSVLRDKVGLQPADRAPVGIGPVPVVIADKRTLVVAGGGAVHRSIWQATQALTFSAVTTPRQSAIVEIPELT